MVAKRENRNWKLGSSDHLPIKDFTDVQAWRLARELRKNIYDLTRGFPADEKHILTAQIRRAALSATANIAEGFGRFSYQENLQFCRQARGSAYEIRDHLTAAVDGGYLKPTEWEQVDALAQRTIEVLNGYIRATRSRQGSKQAK